MKHHNFIDQQLHEVLWSISYCQTYQRFTHSTNIHWNLSLMLLTELLMKSQKVWVTKKRCMKLTKMVMLLFLKLRRERKTKRKPKWLKVNLNKLRKKHQLNKPSQLLRVKTTNHQLRVRQSHKVQNQSQPNKVKELPKNNNKMIMAQMTSNNHYPQDHLRAE